MKKTLLILLLVVTCTIQAQNYGPYRQFVNVDFETTGLFDNLNNTTINLQNGATVVTDTERNSKVVQFNAEQKGNLKFANSPLNDTITIAFWFKREAVDPLENWRMMFSFAAADGSSVYFTPKTTWSESTFLVYDLKPYSIYSTFTSPATINFKWTHYVVQFLGNTVKIYQDGAIATTASLLTNLSDINATKWYFGCNPETSFSMTGKMDDLKIFHSELSANQIKALYENKTIPAPVDAVKPFTYIPLDVNANDVNNNVSTTATNVSFENDNQAGKVAQLGAEGRISYSSNPFGNYKFSLSMMLKKEDFSSDNGKYIFKAKNGTNDFVGIRLNNANNQNVLEVVGYQNNTLNIIATTSASNLLLPNVWNSIVFVQTYGTSGNSAIRLYINGTSALVKAGIDVNSYSFTNWFIGSDGNDNLACKINEIKTYQRELASTEVSGLHAGQTNTVTFTSDYNQKKQTIHNFGSSDGWNTQPVGLYFSNPQKEKLAELLFSTEKDAQGTPKGIGLSAWRFNIGAGTSEQGSASRITSEYRRSECFLNANGTYNWSKQAGQRYFLEKAAKTYNVPDIIGWQNSPPIHFTVRGLGFREFGDAKQSILKTDKYADFGKFLSEVVLHFKQEGINFKYISPLNEPQWDWAATSANGNVSQEGSPWTNTEISNVTKAINTEFVARGVDAKLLVGEAGMISHLLSGTGTAQNQLTNLWSNSASLTIANLPSVAKIASAHSYFEDTSAETIINNRKNLNTRMAADFQNLEYWQTEYSLLNNGYKFGFPTERIMTPMESGIALARIIHSDLTQANATGWQWWTTFEMVKNLSAEDRFALIKVAINSTNSGGIFNTTKLLYSLGNFSHFIRPGSKRISISRSDNMTDVNSVTNLMVSAYINDSANELIYVVINPTTSEKGVKLATENLPGNMSVSEFTPYITSDNSSDNLKKYPVFNASDRYSVPPTSIVTFVGKISQGTSIDNTSMSLDCMKIFPNPASEVVNIYFSNTSTSATLTITDLSGKQIFNKQLRKPTNQYSIPSQSFKKGIYFVDIKNNTYSKTQKLIIQ
jgi:O-glycosyl hydrolase